MGRVAKIIEKMKANPKDDWRMEQFETIAAHYGVNICKTGGSHVVFDHPKWIELMTVPARRPIKPIYVKKFVVLIDMLEVPDERS